MSREEYEFRGSWAWAIRAAIAPWYAHSAARSIAIETVFPDLDRLRFTCSEAARRSICATTVAHMTATISSMTAMNDTWHSCFRWRPKAISVLRKVLSGRRMSLRLETPFSQHVVRRRRLLQATQREPKLGFVHSVVRRNGWPNENHDGAECGKRQDSR